MFTAIQKYFQKNTQAAPLAVFRVLFGFMMFLGIVRFWANGWIEKLYIQPKFFFSYYGFEWVKPIGNYTYIIFAICGIAALFVALGYKYRVAIIVFFLSFTYIELMDKTTYLNHYYFISCVAFLMIFLPANVYFSVDAYKNPRKAFQMVPKWTIDSIKLILGIVYFYAGLAKLNSDWLFNAMPLKIWLPSKYDLPFLGDLMQQPWVHYTFSWSGALYDLAIPFLLLYRRTRWFAFALVVTFHVMTRVLFPIGMFPYIMIVSTLIFFDTGFHRKVIRFISKLLRIYYSKMVALSQTRKYRFKRNIALPILAVFFMIQLLFPWRYLAYPNELFWTEEGYRFSWRVMLMEKAGYAQFKIKNTETGEQFLVDNTDFLTPFQEKQMSTQPDFILEYAHFLGEHFEAQGHENVAVYAESYVALNGRLSQPYVDPNVDLMKQRESFRRKNWILPFNDTIKGL
ncbi:HTTM domain-containing protein [Aequorivita vladivostokensis]|uniref:Deoxyribonuclease HsdR n=1 Tax=Aequorivita vladivostokensis TaxID=171194 RepID=A0ABR5DFK4_9FLAO|nr:HTTM domain-containing protein [Aequorivita vladivostokensis]KJJ37563.1 deoxyribonuclease HsdR [Aequorivita vladivostokensis]HBL80942.1 HTTM domain-containing protein [Aequorivita sp.]